MTDTGFLLICSGYLVEQGKVLLVHHNKFNKWVPPGGHFEAGETFAQNAVREFREETGLAVEAISGGATIEPIDPDTRPEPVPFYVDLEYNGFEKPAIVQFFFVRRKGDNPLVPQAAEVHSAAWFSLKELNTIPTFQQVRSLARYSLMNYPVASERHATES